MSRSVRMFVPAAIAAVTLCALLAGCSAPAPASTVTVTTPPETSATPSPTASASVTPTPPPVDPTDPNAPAAQCADDAIGTQVLPADSGAGSMYYQLVFTNTGTADCELRGYPGVSVVGDGNGTQLGASAEHFDGMEIATYPLKPGDSIGASIQMVNIGTDGGPLGDACDVAAGDGWRIYPPHSFVAVFVESPGLPACLSSDVSWLRVGALSAE
ncbi:DUF4232 domain-containing protein [Naasia lichenicola]|uniref:DUF4232 domain-containing protein n=1 Tax=Naasia lichenicola TaxID=2565933 RepID=A0A4S4FLT2_9MICO|nr:DUF4232 domain-containing protein [Naasia lichenicola]THG30862.1 DUF4232 domain-containing protein [Naasia lichenicola]